MPNNYKNNSIKNNNPAASGIFQEVKTMRFSKYNNPNKRRARKYSPYTKIERETRENELYKLLAAAETETERDALIKVFRASV